MIAIRLLSDGRLVAQVLREAKEREANVLELRAQEAKIRSQLQFEARKDLPGAIEKLKGTIADDEATLERKLARQAELEKEAEALRSQARDRRDHAEIAPRSGEGGSLDHLPYLAGGRARERGARRAGRGRCQGRGGEGCEEIAACVRRRARPPPSGGACAVSTSLLISYLDHLPHIVSGPPSLYGR